MLDGLCHIPFPHGYCTHFFSFAFFLCCSFFFIVIFYSCCLLLTGGLYDYDIGFAMRMWIFGLLLCIYVWWYGRNTSLVFFISQTYSECAHLFVNNPKNNSNGAFEMRVPTGKRGARLIWSNHTGQSMASFVCVCAYEIHQATV